MTTSDTEATALAAFMAKRPTYDSSVFGKHIRATMSPHERDTIVAALNDRDALLAQVEVMREALKQVVSHETAMARFEPETHDAIIAALSHSTGAA